MALSAKFVRTTLCAALVTLTPAAAGSALAGHGHQKSHHHGHNHHHNPHHGHHKPNYHWHVPQYKWIAPPVYAPPVVTTCAAPPVTCVAPPPPCSAPPVTCVQPVVSPCAQATASTVAQAASAPETNELPGFEGTGMAIMNTETRDVSFTVDGKSYKLRPGFQMDFNTKPSYTIVFDRGGKFGTAKYAVQDGKTYRFRAAADTGWDLKATTRTVADAKPIAEPPADEQ